MGAVPTSLIWKLFVDELPGSVADISSRCRNLGSHPELQTDTTERKKLAHEHVTADKREVEGRFRP
jgi:hypothetical protein